MTVEELEEALEEGTWLVCTSIIGEALSPLVRVIGNPSESKVYWNLRGSNGVGYFTHRQNLRIATPNDMLKYGE